MLSCPIFTYYGSFSEAFDQPELFYLTAFDFIEIFDISYN